MKARTRKISVSCGILAAGAVTGGVGYAFAPAIAATLGAAGLLGSCATTGTAISTLSGVALTNAALATLGGGAIPIGFGMAGGTAVVTASTGAAGVAISGIGTVAHKYQKSL